MKDSRSLFDLLHEAAGTLPSRTLAAGEVLVEQGGRLDALYLIESGSFVIRQTEGLTEPVAVGTRKVGEWVGDVGVIAPGPATATVEAVVETRVSVLSHARYAELRDKNSPAAGQLLSMFCRAFAGRLRRTGQQRAGGASTVQTLRALYGDESAPARASWTPRSATGHSARMDSRDIVAALDAAGAFRPVDVVDRAYAEALRRDVEMLAPTFGVQSHEDGDLIVKAGDGVDGLFVILEGNVRVTIGGQDGSLAVDRLLRPGQVFGQVAFFDGGSRSATCAADGSLKLAVVYPAAVQELMAGAEKGRSMGLHFMDWIARQLASDLRDMHRRVTASSMRAFGSA